MFIVVVLVYASGRGWCVPLQRSRREVPTDRALACGCSTMPGGGVDKVRACLCTLARSWMEWRVLATLTRHLQVCAFATEPP